MKKSARKTIKEMLSPEDIAEYLNISISTVYRYLNDKEDPIPSYKFSSKNIRIKKEDLGLWMMRKTAAEKQHE